MSRWVLALGFIAVAAVPSTALTGEGLQTIRGSVKVLRVGCIIAPCPPPQVTLVVPDRKDKVTLTGEASKRLVDLEGKRIEVVGTFDAAKPLLFNVKTFTVLPDERPRN